MTKYLEKLGKCQEAPYYECIASQIDVLQDCTNKCIPKELSTVEKNYSTIICQDDRNVKHCFKKHFHRRKDLFFLLKVSIEEEEP